MRAVILGAGASHGRGGGGALRPPLTHQFFQLGVKLGLFDKSIGANLEQEIADEVGISIEELRRRTEPVLDLGPDPSHLSVLKAFVEEQMGVSWSEYPTCPIDIERLLGLIEGELLGYHGLLHLAGKVPLGPGSADVLQQQLYLILCGTLVATASSSCPYHAALAHSLAPGDLVISFNYDLLIDRALRSRGDWYFNDGYGLEFHRIGRRAADDAEWRAPLQTRSAIKLLKPHGSLNWLYPRDASQSNLNLDLHGVERPRPALVLYCLEDLHEAFLEDHPVYEWWERYEHEEDGRIFDMHALIVPPAITKPYRSFEPYIGPVWARALQALLSSATELLFVGYSLRPEDLRSWWLFRKTAAEAERLTRVTVVDPSEDVFNRIQEVFAGREVVRAANTLADYSTGAGVT